MLGILPCRHCPCVFSFTIISRFFFVIPELDFSPTFIPVRHAKRVTAAYKPEREYSRPQSLQNPPISGGFCNGAGNGNRTRIKSLGSSHSTIELYPRQKHLYYKHISLLINTFFTKMPPLGSTFAYSLIIRIYNRRCINHRLTV